MEEEAKQAVLATWEQLAGRRRANEEFKLEQAIELEGIPIPRRTLVKVWAARTKSKPKQPRKLGTFFLEAQQVSVMSDGRVETRSTPRRNPASAGLPIATPLTGSFGRNARPS